MSVAPEFLSPHTPIAPGVRLCSTLRAGGISRGPYGGWPDGERGFNLGAHCGDDPDAVEVNRAMLEQTLPGVPHWLNQVHGRGVVEISASSTLPMIGPPAPVRADASVTRERDRVLAVLTADCLPVVFADQQGRAIGIAHAGWRGLAMGVLEATLEAVLRLSGGAPADCAVWLGPSIGPDHFEVGPDVFHAFCDQDPGAASAFRAATVKDKWRADLPALARLRLRACGVETFSGGLWCTFADRRRFYSFRRDRVTGRMATLVWISGL